MFFVHAFVFFFFFDEIIDRIKLCLKFGQKKHFFHFHEKTLFTQNINATKAFFNFFFAFFQQWTVSLFKNKNPLLFELFFQSYKQSFFIRQSPFFLLGVSNLYYIILREVLALPQWIFPYLMGLLAPSLVWWKILAKRRTLIVQRMSMASHWSTQVLQRFLISNFFKRYHPFFLSGQPNYRLCFFFLNSITQKTFL